jgi:hypothetical protein
MLALVTGILLCAEADRQRKGGSSNSAGFVADRDHACFLPASSWPNGRLVRVVAATQRKQEPIKSRSVEGASAKGVPQACPLARENRVPDLSLSVETLAILRHMAPLHLPRCDTGHGSPALGLPFTEFSAILFNSKANCASSDSSVAYASVAARSSPRLL